MNAQRLKNSILQEAIEGRLVPQDPNDEPASVLLERIRAEKKRLVKEGKLKKKDLEETPISEDEIPFKIPESWVWCRLGNLISYQNGYAYNSSEMNKEGIGVPVIKSGNLMTLEVVLKPNNDFIEHPNEKMLASKIVKGDMLMCLSSQSDNPEPLGKTAIYKFDSYALLNQRVLKFRPYIDELTLYLYYTINSFYFWYNVSHQGGGSAQANLKLNHVLDMLIPLPPLAEQKRIVAKIEELLPKVEEYGKAQEALDKLNEELPEKLKKSVLQEAITGKLVPQDANDEPASVLLNRIREEKKRLVKEGKLKKKDLEETPINEDEIPFEIPESWEWCKLGKIAALIGGFAFKSHEYTSSGSRVIRISDITENGFINKNVVRFPFTDKLSQYVILEGDILMAMTGGTVGKSMYVKHLPEETMLLNQRVALIRPNIVFTDYIDYVIKSQHIQGIITEAKNSTNDNISMGDLYNFPIPLPPLSEQKRIVAKIEELMHEIDKLKV